VRGGLKYLKLERRRSRTVISVDIMHSRNAQHRDGTEVRLPAWADRMPLIRAALKNIATQFIDRGQIGELFGVGPYQAGRLIHDMGPIRHGNSLVVDAEDIRRMLSEMERDKEVRDLRRRLSEKGSEIEPTRRKSKTRPEGAPDIRVNVLKQRVKTTSSRVAPLLWRFIVAASATGRMNPRHWNCCREAIRP
jgi:hypothetical protein